MSGSLLSDYGVGDTNFDNMMLSLDGQRVGYSALSLSSFDSDSIAVIEAGGRVEVGGALYKFASDESISTTDPYTSATVADGTVYIVLRLASGVITASWTATAPVWRADYQGYYKLNTVDRYVGGCSLTGTTTEFNGKYIYNKQDVYPYQDNVPAETYITANGTWTPESSKYYGIWMTGKGGNGSDATGAVYAGGGGGALTGYKRIKIEAGTTWTATFSASSGGSLLFTDGSTNLRVQNGFNSITPAAYGFFGGLGGYTYTGMDITYKGQTGQFGPIKISTASTYAAGGGGTSFYGGGGQMNPGGIGESGPYGAGGAGGCYDGSNRAGGAGGNALIRIVG